MTPRKELFTKVKEELLKIPELELIELQRKQFSSGKDNYPDFYTVALIEIKSITWTAMVQQKQEGKCTIDIHFYCKDGWVNPDLIEIDIVDKIVEKLQGLHGDQFTPLHHSLEEPGNETEEIMSYKLSFETSMYMSDTKYTYKKIKLTM